VSRPAGWKIPHGVKVAGTVLLPKGVDAAGDPMAEVAGRADVLVCPGLDSANLLYKLVMSLAHHGQASMASITVGLKVPYVVVSRADPLANKLNSVALCCVYDEHLKNPDAKAKSAAPGR